MKDPKYGLFFHNDKSHEYTFDDSQFQCGAIFGRKVCRPDDESQSKKITASKLSSIHELLDIALFNDDKIKAAIKQKKLQ